MAKGNSISIHNVNDLFILKEVKHSGADILILKHTRLSERHLEICACVGSRFYFARKVLCGLR